MKRTDKITVMFDLQYKQPVLGISLSSQESWDEQSCQYRQKFYTGIHYARATTHAEDTQYVNCFLGYDDDGKLCGILNHYPFDFQYDKTGDFIVIVRPDMRRLGVGSALVAEADRLLDLNFMQQRYSPSGLALAKHYVTRFHSDDVLRPTNLYREENESPITEELRAYRDGLQQCRDNAPCKLDRYRILSRERRAYREGYETAKALMDKGFLDLFMAYVTPKKGAPEA